MTNRIDMINQALIAIGAVPLQSETAPNGPRYVAIYNLTIGNLCSEYPWTFQTGFEQLAQLTVKPVRNKWLYAYALPSGMTGEPQAAYDRIDIGTWQPIGEPVKEFEIYGGVLYANYTQIYLRFTRDPAEAIWPAYFQNLAVKLLMAELAVPAREDAPLRQALMQEVYGSPEHQGEGGLIAKCKAINSQGRPSRKLAIGFNPLTAVRRT
jgi:hypothetical protein